MKKLLIISSVTILLLFLSGCYNYKELNEIAIVSSIGVDKKDDEYLISAQVMNAKSDNDSEDSQIIVYEAKGKTIHEGLRNMTSKSSRKLYGGHLSKLVLSKDVAKENIINTIDIFERLTEVRNEFTITVSKDIDANKVIKVMTSLEEVPAEYVKSTIQTADITSALTYSTKVDEFTSLYLKKYIDPVISVIEVKNYSKKGTTTDNITTTDPKTKIELGNIAVTNKGKLETFLNKKETIGYNYLRNQIQEMIIPVKCDDNNYASIEVLKNKTKNKIRRDKDNYIITFNINTDAIISEYNCSNDLTDDKTIKKIEKETKKEIEKYIKAALKKQENTKSEFLGLKRIIYVNDKNYNNEKYNVRLNINVNVARKGELRQSIKGAKNNEY